MDDIQSCQKPVGTASRRYKNGLEEVLKEPFRQENVKGWRTRVERGFDAGWGLTMDNHTDTVVIPT